MRGVINITELQVVEIIDYNSAQGVCYYKGLICVGDTVEVDTSTPDYIIIL